jgi:hypothetical protein
MNILVIPETYVEEALKRTTRDLGGIDVDGPWAKNPEVPCCDFNAVVAITTAHLNQVIEENQDK